MQIGSMGCRPDRKLNARVTCEDAKPRCEQAALLGVSGRGHVATATQPLHFSSPGQGVSVCDKLQCVCDKTTAECMAAARFNHSLPVQQCHGPAPSCRRASRPPKPRLSSESSEEAQGGASDSGELTHQTTTTSPLPPGGRDR